MNSHFQKPGNSNTFFWHKVHRGCKSHGELQKPSAAHFCSFHPLNTNVHTDRLRTKTSSPYVPKGWLVPTQGKWQPAQHQPQRAQQQDKTEAPPPVPVTTAARVSLCLGDFYLEIQGLVFKSFHLHKLTSKNTFMHRLGEKKKRKGKKKSSLSKWACMRHSCTGIQNQHRARNIKA